MRKIVQKVILFFLFLLFLMGCRADESDGMEKLEEKPEKEMASLMDDTYYIADVSGILILCEEEGDLEYQENIQLLKGDKESVEEAVKRLQGMEQTAAVKNAIGAGYIRLAQCEEARKVLNEALSLSEKDSEQACILNNLASIRLITEEDFMQNRIAARYEQAVKKERNPQNRLIIEMNRIYYGPLTYLDKKDPTGYALNEFERLLEEEKKILGSNQIVGVYGYSALSVFLADDELLKKDEIRWINKAMEINKRNHQYKAANITIYSELAGCYYHIGEIEKALEYVDKWISLAEGFLAETDDVMYIRGYFHKATILTKGDRYDEAIECINTLLDKKKIHIEKRAIAWFILGEVYYSKNEVTNAQEMVSKGYEIFKQYKSENGYGEGEWEIEEITKMYDRDNYDDENSKYLPWLKEQLEKLAQK